MNKSFFNIVLLSMLLLLSACTSESINPTSETPDDSIDDNTPPTSPIIDESAFTIPTISSAHGRAQVAKFTIPAGFADVTSDVSVTFNNKDNLLNEKQAAVKKAMYAINATSKGLVVDSVGAFKMDGNAGWNASGNIEVVFRAAKGFKFENPFTTTRKVIIHFTGAFIDTKQTIEEIPFATKYRGKASGRAGISSITFKHNLNTSGGNIPRFEFNSSDYATQKNEAVAGLNYMFIEENKNFGGALPEGIKYNKNNVKIKKQANGDDEWYGNYAIFEVTFDATDTDYEFAGNNKYQKTVDIKISVLHFGK